MNGPNDNAKLLALSSGPFILEGLIRIRYSIAEIVALTDIEKRGEMQYGEMGGACCPLGVLVSSDLSLFLFLIRILPK